MDSSIVDPLVYTPIWPRPLPGAMCISILSYSNSATRNWDNGARIPQYQLSGSCFGRAQKLVSTSNCCAHSNIVPIYIPPYGHGHFLELCVLVFYHIVTQTSGSWCKTVWQYGWNAQVPTFWKFVWMFPKVSIHVNLLYPFKYCAYDWHNTRCNLAWSSRMCQLVTQTKWDSTTMTVYLLGHHIVGHPIGYWNSCQL